MTLRNPFWLLMAWLWDRRVAHWQRAQVDLFTNQGQSEFEFIRFCASRFAEQAERGEANARDHARACRKCA